MSDEIQLATGAEDRAPVRGAVPECRPGPRQGWGIATLLYLRSEIGRTLAASESRKTVRMATRRLAEYSSGRIARRRDTSQVISLWHGELARYVHCVLI